MARRNAAFTPAQIRQAVREAEAAGLRISEIRVLPDGTLRFEAREDTDLQVAPGPQGGREGFEAGQQERRLPKGVRLQVKRLGSGETVRYGYFVKGKETVALGRHGTLAFEQALAKIQDRSPAEGTLLNLIWRYKQSPEFRKLRSRTQADYRVRLDRIQERFGGLSLDALSERQFARDVYAWRDTMGGGLRQADYAVQVLKLLLSWGCRRGYLDTNRAAGVDQLYRSQRRERTWTATQVDAFLVVAPVTMRRAMVLALETGQRQGDLLALPWSAIEGDVIFLRQSKTGARVAIPISSALREYLDDAPSRGEGTILMRLDGQAWDPNGGGFRNAWRDVCRAAHVTGVTFHDLRGTFVTRRLAEGWTTVEVAM